MEQTAARRLRLIYGALFTILTLFLAYRFIEEAVSIYDAGGYSREIVGEHLGELLLPAVLWLAAAVVGYVLAVLLPVCEKKGKISPLARLMRRIPAGEGDEFKAEKRRFDRYTHIILAVWAAGVLTAVASVIVTAVYFADPAHFGGEVTEEVFSLLIHVCPWVGATFLIFVGAGVTELVLEKRRVASAKALLVLGKGCPPAPPSAIKERAEAAIDKMGSEKVLFFVRIALLVLAVVLIGVGIWNGGAGDVLKKAINICTECIGLG